MKLTQQDRAVEEILRNISGKTLEDIDDVLKALMIYALMQYSEGELVRFPYFGSFKMNYKGDKITDDGREAELDTMYFPSNDIKLNLGMLEDARNGKCKITDIPIIESLMREINTQLNYVSNEINMEYEED